jgi:hypothetical protein
VGPESCRAHPGPVCYKKGGHLAITDANLQLGRILPDTFPKIFGPKEVCRGGLQGLEGCGQGVGLGMERRLEVWQGAHDTQTFGVQQQITWTYLPPFSPPGMAALPVVTHYISDLPQPGTSRTPRPTQ